MNETLTAKGTYKVVKQQIENGCDINSINQNGETALHVAISSRGYYSNQNKIIIKLLLNKGINVYMQDKNGNTALHLAQIKGRDYDIIDLLINFHDHFNVVNSFDETPVHIALRNNDMYIINAMLKKSDDTKHYIDYEANTYLHYIIKENLNCDFISIFANKDNVNMKDNYKDLPLNLALKKKDKH